MFRKLVIAFVTAVAAILETAADAIAATLPPPAADSPRLRVVASGEVMPQGCPSCHRLRVNPGPRRQVSGAQPRAVMAGLVPAAGGAPGSNRKDETMARTPPIPAGQPLDATRKAAGQVVTLAGAEAVAVQVAASLTLAALLRPLIPAARAMAGLASALGHRLPLRPLRSSRWW
jgi:hypothetical protein